MQCMWCISDLILIIWHGEQEQSVSFPLPALSHPGELHGGPLHGSGSGESRYIRESHRHGQSAAAREIRHLTVSCECLRAFLCLVLQGKSLSLICGALTWLRDYEQQKKQEAAKLLDGPEKKCDAVKEENSTSQTSESDWVSEFVQKKAERDIVNKLKVWELLCVSHSSSDQTKSCVSKQGFQPGS